MFVCVCVCVCVVCCVCVCVCSGAAKLEEGAELYVRAANSFKMAKRYTGTHACMYS